MYNSLTHHGLRLLLVLILLAVGPLAAQERSNEEVFSSNHVWLIAQAGQCGSGQSWCPRGEWGEGGCFATSAANCQQGMVCSRGEAMCPPGRHGSGGCYRAAAAVCRDGITCSRGESVCVPPGGGAAYCYRPSATRCS